MGITLIKAQAGDSAVIQLQEMDSARLCYIP